MTLNEQSIITGMNIIMYFVRLLRQSRTKKTSDLACIHLKCQ